MSFHTWTFALFFIIVYLVYLPLRRTRLKLPWLLLASYVFYASWNPLWPLCLAYTTVTNWVAVILMEKTRRRKLWLVLSIINSLGLLGFFKYARFVTGNVNALLGRLGLSYTIAEPGWVFPIGISFFTFQAMSYTIDCYLGKCERERSLIRFATFVALFPRLMMGPIERARNLLPQLRRPTEISGRDITDGLSLFVVGLFKKIALADYLGQYVDKVYDAPEQFQAAALILATFAFAWQIYFDFSGYTDMARGVARMMGFNLMLNFNNPY
ncbi:MAG: MBOAT family protein, partial [Candidatus Brocadiae bacterium]|nr:MBOAT family protein [Candidatus Brocadiia bacterium]